MRTLGPIVQPLSPKVDAGEAKITKGGIVGAIVVSDDRIGRDPLILQQLAHQAQRCIFVSSGLDQKVENFTLIIDGTPQVHLPTGDRDENFVEMPSSRRSRAAGPKATRIDRTKMRHPSADRLMGDKDAALSEKILDISEAQREAQVQPDGVLDDH